MRKSWRLMVDPPLSGERNMAVDTMLLEKANSGNCGPTLRLYSWNRPTLSIGYGQDISKRVNMDFVNENKIPIVRRPTGGRAMLHDDEITYSIVIPASNRYYGSLKNIYDFSAAAIKSALAGLGVRMDEEASGNGIRGSALCFATKTRHEITCSGKKIAGSAQRRLRRAALQHGSISLSHDKEFYLSCFNWKNESEREIAKSLLGSVNDFMAEPVSGNDVKNSIVAAFSNLYDINIVESDLSINELNVVESSEINVYEPTGGVCHE